MSGQQKTIREIALEERRKMGYLGETSTEVALIERVLAEYLAQQEPFGYYWNFQNKEDGFIRLDEMTGRRPMKDWIPCFLAPPIPAGMQIVPVEPTQAMLDALYNLETDGDILGETDGYKAMLAAAKE